MKNFETPLRQFRVTFHFYKESSSLDEKWRFEFLLKISVDESIKGILTL